VMLSPAVAEKMVQGEVLELDLTPHLPLPSASFSPPKNRQIRENGDLLIVLGIALLAIPGYFVFHDMAFVVVPIVVSIIMLRDPLAKRVSWLRWMKRVR
jgi:hypothetical protein